MLTPTRSPGRAVFARVLAVVACVFPFLAPAAEPAKVTALALPAVAALPFAHEGSDLKPDPAVRFGKLPNGVRYAVTANKEPKGRASLRLLVLAGLFHETEEQRGVAHFLEHMAFNGSTHYAPGTLVEFFQRMGMSFGGDTNASTGFDRTLYLSNSPTPTPPRSPRACACSATTPAASCSIPMKSTRSAASSSPKNASAIPSASAELTARFDFMLGDTLLPPSVSPIGTVEVITGAPRERFVEFWNAWIALKIAVIAVGDFDAAAVEQQIAAQFSFLGSPPGPPPCPSPISARLCCSPASAPNSTPSPRPRPHRLQSAASPLTP